MSAHKAFIDRVAEVSAAFAWQSGVGAMEIAGQIISVLHANPERIDRFMAEGSELFLDGTLSPENGSLSYMAISGRVTHPSVLRKHKGLEQ
jgi:hypothetical protein